MDIPRVHRDDNQGNLSVDGVGVVEDMYRGDVLHLQECRVLDERQEVEEEMSEVVVVEQEEDLNLEEDVVTDLPNSNGMNTDWVLFTHLYCVIYIYIYAT